MDIYCTSFPIQNFDSFLNLNNLPLAITFFVLFVDLDQNRVIGSCEKLL